MPELGHQPRVRGCPARLALRNFCTRSVRRVAEAENSLHHGREPIMRTVRRPYAQSFDVPPGRSAAIAAISRIALRAPCAKEEGETWPEASLAMSTSITAIRPKALYKCTSRPSALQLKASLKCSLPSPNSVSHPTRSYKTASRWVTRRLVENDRRKETPTVSARADTASLSQAEVGV